MVSSFPASKTVSYQMHSSTLAIRFLVHKTMTSLTPNSYRDKVDSFGQRCSLSETICASTNKYDYRIVLRVQTCSFSDGTIPFTIGSLYLLNQGATNGDSALLGFFTLYWSSSILLPHLVAGQTFPDYRLLVLGVINRTLLQMDLSLYMSG